VWRKVKLERLAKRKSKRSLLREGITLLKVIFSVGLLFGSINTFGSYTETITNEYDDLNRLKSSSTGNGISQTYNYDDSHNRTSFTSVGADPASPTALNDSFSTPESIQLVVTASGLLSNDTDPNSLTLLVSDSTLPESGVLQLNANGTFTYTPESGFSGVDQFTYQISNGTQISNFAVVEIIVSASNLPPTTQPDVLTVPEDSGVTSILVLSNDSDPEGGVLTLDSIDYTGSNTVIINGDNVEFTPNQDYFGTEVFSYTVSDANGAESTEQVSITVSAQNDDPLLQTDNIWIRVGMTAVIGVLANDQDGDADQLTISSVTYTGISTVTHDDLFISYTPDNSFSNGDTDTFDYEVTDGNGGTTSSTVTVHILGNMPPVARPDVYITQEETSIDLRVLRNDTDPDGDEVTIVSASFPSPSSVGIIQIVDGEFIRYTPPDNMSGTQSILYTIEDAFGASSTSVVNVRVDEDIVEFNPIATNDSAATLMNTPETISVLANDYSPSVVPVSIFSFDTQTVLGGSISQSGDNLIYTPPTNFIGTDQFNYRIESSGPNTDIQRFATARVTIRVIDPATIPAALAPVIFLLLLDNDEPQN